MDLELSAEAKDKRLNRMVAMTVVVLSVFTGVANIKDGNIVQAMEQAQANSVDRWNEYQAARLKGKLAEATRVQVRVAAATRVDSPAVKAVLAGIDGDVAHYAADAPRLRTQAKGFADQYDALNVHDDQFDASDAAIATAISIAAVAALVESLGLLAVAWVLGAFGLFMGVCGFAGWSFHPDILSSWLG
jgi:hypothetical protein